MEAAMTLLSTKFEPTEAADAALSAHPVPKIRIDAFCEASETLDALTAAAGDRRMLRAKMDAQMGGIRSAIRRYRDTASPDLVILERQIPGDLLLEELEKLAEVCDADTKVIVIGASNDIRLYRDLMGRGISDYLVAPVESLSVVAAIVRLYQDGSARKLGRTYAFIGAKGGVGSSTVAHNVATVLADGMSQDAILADMDLAFGTAGLDFNIDSPQSVADALDSGSNLDELLFERLLVSCSDRLSMLAAPTSLGRTYDLNEEDIDALLDVARGSTGHLFLDMPHVWCAWSRRMLVCADEVVLTATPDLANLRNVKSLVEALGKSRPNDAPPKLVLNQVGIPKRPQIKPAEFAKAVGLDPVATITFDPRLFGTASNNGQMISDIARRSAAPFASVATALLDGAGSRGASRRGFVSKLLGRRPST
jgi:pilus assembly protein CpaE